MCPIIFSVANEDLRPRVAGTTLDVRAERLRWHTQLWNTPKKMPYTYKTVLWLSVTILSLMTPCNMADKMSCTLTSLFFIYHLLHIIFYHISSHTLRWRHNDHAGVSNHQPHGCLLNRLFRRNSKKTSKLRVTGLCAGNSPGTGEFPAQMASYAENVSIWWRHHDHITSHLVTSCHVTSRLVSSHHLISSYLIYLFCQDTYCRGSVDSHHWNSSSRRNRGHRTCMDSLYCSYR